MAQNCIIAMHCAYCFRHKVSFSFPPKASLETIHTYYQGQSRQKLTRESIKMKQAEPYQDLPSYTFKFFIKFEMQHENELARRGRALVQ